MRAGIGWSTLLGRRVDRASFVAVATTNSRHGAAEQVRPSRSSEKKPRRNGLSWGFSRIRRRAVSAASAPLEPLPSGCSYGAAGPGPNLSRNRLCGVPLRWSHPCLLQFQPIATVAKPDLIKVSGRSVLAFAKHIQRLRPSFRDVNTKFFEGIFFSQRGHEVATQSEIIQALGSILRFCRTIHWCTSNLPAPILFSIRKRRPQSNNPALSPRGLTPWCSPAQHQRVRLRSGA